MSSLTSLYIGIDPDLRLLNAAIVLKRPGIAPEAKQVFIRRNKEGIDDEAVVNASRMACKLAEDITAYLTAEEVLQANEIVLVVESQNMQHALESRRTGRAKIVPDDIRRLAQVAGCMMGVFNYLATRIVLVQPKQWKGDLPKDVSHNRIYPKLNLQISLTGKVKNIYPIKEQFDAITHWSEDKVNEGDFADINDSLGLALYGAVKGL